MSDLGDNAILVYGCRKSGTTLVQSLLDGSPSIMMTLGELKFKLIREMEALPEQEKAARYFTSGRNLWRKKGGIVARREGRGQDVTAAEPERFRVGTLAEEQTATALDKKRYFDELLRFRGFREDRTMRALILHDVMSLKSALRVQHPFRYWASKEVGGDPALTLAYFTRLFPKGRLILLMRNPLFTVRSSLIFKRTKKQQTLTWRSIWRQCRSAEQGWRYLDSLPASGSAIKVRYEQLVEDTEREMRRVTDFLSIPWDPVFLVPTTLGIPSQVTTASREAAHVFRSSATGWTDGLTFMEALAVRLYPFARITASTGSRGPALPGLRTTTAGRGKTRP